MFSAPASPLKEINITNWKITKNFVFKNLQLPGIMIEHLGLYDCSQTPKQELNSIYTKETILQLHDRISLDILVSLNLVEKVNQSFFQNYNFPNDNKHELNSVAFCMTTMGAIFFTECSRQDVNCDKG